MKDYIVKAYAFNDSVRIYAANSTALVNEAQKIHDLWPTSAAAFGRLLTASVIMGAMYKGDQELTIRVESDGPIGGMVTHANAIGDVKGYVVNNHVFLQYDSGKLNVGKAVGNGFIHVTKDLKIKQAFTSSAPIQTGEIAEDFAYYFTASEQIPSAVGLGVLVNDDNTILASGGFILQVMPGIKEEQLQSKRAKEQLVSSLESIKIATDFERKRRIKRAIYDNEKDRYLKDKATLESIIENTPLSTEPIAAEDFDFGETQSATIQILKDIQNVDEGYYIIIAVHKDKVKRDAFLEKVVATGQSNINFFFDVNTNKYFIYYEKFDYVDAAMRALEAKGSKPYNGKMSVIKIEN